MHYLLLFLNLNISATMKGLAKWDHYFSIGFRFRNLEGGERKRERDSTAEGRETYDRLSHV